MHWDISKIKDALDNPSSLRRAGMLAKSSKWADLSTNYELIWGLCTVLEHQHYAVGVHLLTGQYQCNCMAKNMCKHVAGILMLYLKSSALFKHQNAPKHLQQWQQSGSLPSGGNTKSSVLSKRKINENKAALDKEKRWQKRLQLMDDGIDALDYWLQDMVRQGLANVPVEQTDFWDFMAAKMMDAKLPALSSYLKETAQLIQQHSDWTELLVHRMGSLYTWVAAFKNRANMPENMQHNLYRSLGKTSLRKAVTEQGIAVKDKWLTVGIRMGETVDKQVYRRVWLQGMDSSKMALIEDYSYYKNPFEHQYQLGTVLDSKLFYYDYLPQQRAILEHPEQRLPAAIISWQGYPDFEAAQYAFHQNMQQHPWMRLFPMLIDQLSFFINKNNALNCCDNNNNLIPLESVSEASKWQLMAVSGGSPVCIMGEWDGWRLQPLAILQDAKFILLD